MLFFNSASVLINFFMLLIPITIVILRHILYLLYLCRIDVTFFIVINHITSFKQTYLFFVHYLECLLLFLDDNEDEESG